MMTDLNPGGGAYKRWPGVQYHPDDVKGKGEPSYSIEKALKEHSLTEKNGEDGMGVAIEMKSQSKTRSRSGTGTGTGSRPGTGNGTGAGTGTGTGIQNVQFQSSRDEGENAEGRSGGFTGLKKRIGSLRKSRDRDRD